MKNMKKIALMKFQMKQISITKQQKVILFMTKKYYK